MLNIAEKRLQALWSSGLRFLGADVAIMGGAMTWVSDSTLVAAISNAGGFGVIACGSMSPDLLSAEIVKTKQLTSRPFGVNLITVHPQLEKLMDVCCQHNVTHVVLAGGLPNTQSINLLKSSKIKVIGFASAAIIGKKLIKMGIDALIIEGNEAGGHIGPVSTSVLVQEILPQIKEVPIFVAGGIGRGEAIVAYLEMGAAGCQLGTKFVCATESKAHPNFKKEFIKANARDAVASVQLDPRFPVIPVRALANRATQKFQEMQTEIILRCNSGELPLKEAQLAIEHFWAGSLKSAVIDGDVENGSLMAGQSVGMVTSEQTTSEIINELVNQANVYIAKRDCSAALSMSNND